MSVAEKRTCIDPQHATLSIARQCDLVGLPRSSYYRPVIPQTESVENLQIMPLIDEDTPSTLSSEAAKLEMF